MAQVTREVLQGLDTAINVAWDQRYKNAPNADLWKQIAMPINSKSASENYAFLGSVPGLREFKDERVPGTLSGFSYSIDNKKWESTLDVDRDVIEDDRTGQVMLAVNSLANKAAVHYTKLVTAAFANGLTAVVHDGNEFFDGSHATGSNYQGTGKDLNAANVDAGEILLAGQKDDKGNPLGYRGTHLIVGPYNYSAAKALVEAQLITGGASNPHYKRYEIVYLPHLSTTDKKWAVADLSQGLMPFILQIRTPLTLVSKTDLNSDRAFDKDIFTWGTRARHNVGYGDYQLIVGAVAS